MTSNDEIFTLEDITEIDSNEPLTCISVDSPKHEFLIGALKVPTHNSDDAKAANDLKSEAQSIVGSIARLGRAAGVHLAIATQRPDAKMLPGELKANLGMRAACGHMDSTASAMTLGTGSAVETPGYPKGRAILSIYGNEEKMQVYFADNAWIDEWLTAHNQNPDGTPLETGPAGILSDDDTDKLVGTHLDALEGVDNSDYIKEVHDEDARIKAEHQRRVQELAEKTAGVDADGASVTDDIDSSPAPEDDMVDGMKRPHLSGKVTKKENPLDEWDDVMDDIHELSTEDDDPVAEDGDDADSDSGE